MSGGVNIKELKINEEIREKEVRLIDQHGEQLGVLPLTRAKEMAQQAELDLVMISPNAQPPVCRIMDYGKYRYDQIKKEKEARKAQKIINIKEVRMTPNIDTHDLNVKAKQAERFLENGDKVKVSVRFRGRELGHTNLGRVVLEDFLKILGDKAIVDKQPKMEGRNMVMHLNPGTNK
ncbi:MAG: translation initiation factor IF-3 [Tissierellia bacterium]|nr:translation initiation factor IF-3 [Tissierellia bacterium]